MKKILLLSHCVLNPFCELPQASDRLRKPIIDVFMDKQWGIVQLPCPELCYQALERSSIYPEDKGAASYELYCKELLSPLLKNIDDYIKNDITLGGIVGIQTSPSCSVLDCSGIMTNVLLEELAKIMIFDVPKADMPIDEEADSDGFLATLRAWK